MATGVVGTASMLRARRRDVNVKPNRRLDRKSSRGMLYENEELRLRTININAEVERGQSDIKKLRRENEQLRREIWGLREEYDRLEGLLGLLHGAAAGSLHSSPEFPRKHYDDMEDLGNRRNVVENEQNLQNITCIKFQRSKSCSKVEFDSLSMVDEELSSNACDDGEGNERIGTDASPDVSRVKNNLESIFPEEEYANIQNQREIGVPSSHSERPGKEMSCTPSYEIPTMLELHHNNLWSHSLYTMDSTTNSYHALHSTHHQPNEVFSEIDQVKNRRYLFTDTQARNSHVRDMEIEKKYESPSSDNAKNLTSVSHNSNFIQVSYRNKQENVHVSKQGGLVQSNDFPSQANPTVLCEDDCPSGRSKSLFQEGGNLEELLSDVQENTGQQNTVETTQFMQNAQTRKLWNSSVGCAALTTNQSNNTPTEEELPEDKISSQHGEEAMTPNTQEFHKIEETFVCESDAACTAPHSVSVESSDITQDKREKIAYKLLDHTEQEDGGCQDTSDIQLDLPPRRRQPLPPGCSELADAQLRWLSKSLQNISANDENILFKKRGSFPPANQRTCFTNYVPNSEWTSAANRITQNTQDSNSDRQSKQDANSPNWNRSQSAAQTKQNTTLGETSLSNTSELESCGNNSLKTEVHLSDTKNNELNEPLLCQYLQQRPTSYESAPKQETSLAPTVFSVSLPSSSNMYQSDPLNHTATINSVLQRESEEMKDAILFSRSSRAQDHDSDDRPSDGMYRCIKAYSKTNRKCSSYGSHFQSLHKMSVIVGDTQQGRSLFLDHSLSSSCWQDSLSKEHCVKQVSMSSNSQRKLGFCANKNIRIKENGESNGVPGASLTPPRSLSAVAGAGAGGGASADATVPRSAALAWERANSIGSMSSSVDGRLNITKTKFGGSVAGTEQKLHEESVPWCGCWGNGCI